MVNNLMIIQRLNKARTALPVGAFCSAVAKAGGRLVPCMTCKANNGGCYKTDDLKAACFHYAYSVEIHGYILVARISGCLTIGRSGSCSNLLIQVGTWSSLTRLQAITWGVGARARTFRSTLRGGIPNLLLKKDSSSAAPVQPIVITA